MCKGEIRDLLLPKDLAWGEKPPQPLPANSTVHYKVGRAMMIIADMTMVAITLDNGNGNDGFSLQVELEMIQEGNLLPIPTHLAPSPADEVLLKSPKRCHKEQHSDGVPPGLFRERRQPQLQGIALKLGKTSHKKNRFLSGIARKGGGGGPCPNFLTLFSTMLSLIF